MCNLIDVQTMHMIYMHKMVDVHMLIITYLIFMFNYHICRTCSVATVHTACCGEEVAS